MRTRAARKKGSVMVEMALASSILLPLLLGAFQFGYQLYNYNRLCTAVNEGARYASMRTYRCLDSSSVEHVKSGIRNMVAYGTPDPAEGAIPVLPGFTSNKVSVEYSTTASGVPTRVRVGITSFTIDTVVGKFTFNAKPAISYDYLGRYAPEETE
ncbi:MAG: pilus assembly protein [Bryobacteraceae bacterium]